MLKKRAFSLNHLFADNGTVPEIIQPTQGGISDSFLILGSTMVFFLFASILLTSLGFLFRVPITSMHFFMAAGITFLYALLSLLMRPGPNRLIGISWVVFVLVIAFFLSLWAGNSFLDISYDGQEYHQEALIQLNRGWNPFYQQLNSLQSNNLDRWINHYSKGVWFYATMIFKVTKEIESGKLFHFWSMIAALFLILSFLLRFENLSRSLAVLISFLVAFNPVSVCQSLSYYLDGQLMSLMIILIVVLGFIYRESKWVYYGSLLMVIPVLVNVKLTAGIYAGMTLIGYLAMLWLKSKFEQFRKTLTFALFAFLLGFVLFGFNPYITNTLQMGNPFYPALGTDRSDYTFPQFPANFIGKHSFSLLFYSIFSKSDNVRGPQKKAYLKVPFTVSRDELRAFTDTNAKQGGFGPLFGGAILLSFAILIGALLSLDSRSKKTEPQKSSPAGKEAEADGGSRPKVYLALFCLGLVLATCLINPASSLARFVPQMWLFPIIAVLLAYSLKNKVLRILGCLILVILVLNNALIGYTYYSYNLRMTSLYNQRLGEFADLSRGDPIPFYFGPFLSSNTLRFDRIGIAYSIVEKKEDCLNGKRILPNSIILKCETK